MEQGSHFEKCMLMKMTHLQDLGPKRGIWGGHRVPPTAPCGVVCSSFQPAFLLQTLPDGHMSGTRMDRGVSMPNMLEPKASTANLPILTWGQQTRHHPEKMGLSFYHSQCWGPLASKLIGQTRHVRKYLDTHWFCHTESTGLSLHRAWYYGFTVKH